MDWQMQMFYTRMCSIQEDVLYKNVEKSVASAWTYTSLIFVHFCMSLTIQTQECRHMNIF